MHLAGLATQLSSAPSPPHVRRHDFLQRPAQGHGRRWWRGLQVRTAVGLGGCQLAALAIECRSARESAFPPTALPAALATAHCSLPTVTAQPPPPHNPATTTFVGWLIACTGNLLLNLTAFQLPEAAADAPADKKTPASPTAAGTTEVSAVATV